jgi:hypothetical protein
MDTEDSNEARELLAALALFWNDIRQLHDGFMNGDPHFSEFDHLVRDRAIGLSPRLARWLPDWRDKAALKRAEQLLTDAQITQPPCRPEP